ncbi:MAG: hypothetical protein ACOX0U_04965 [Oscillospiraceae bacterium]
MRSNFGLTHLEFPMLQLGWHKGSEERERGSAALDQTKTGEDSKAAGA